MDTNNNLFLVAWRRMVFEWFPQLWPRLRSGYYCPVCCRPVDTFRPLAEEFAQNARRYGYPYFSMGETINVKHYSCPYCGASDRERLYALYFESLDRQELVARSRLLHFSPGPALSRRLRDMDLFEYRTADIAGRDMDDRIDITCMDAYPDATFDIFICSHVLEHVIDDCAALHELYRILKPGGWGILMVPLMTHLKNSVEDSVATTEADRWRLFGQGDHVRLYAKPDFLKRIAEAGFSVRQLGTEYFGADTFRRCGITYRSILYVVSHD